MSEGSENYSGREIAGSLQSLRLENQGQPIELPPDSEIVRLLEVSGESLIHLYEGWLRESGTETTLKSYLSPQRQLEIVKALVADIPGMIEWRNKNAEKEERKKESVDKTKAQWATVATTPPVEYVYDTDKEVEIMTKKLDRLGVQYNLEGRKVTVFGNRISFAFWKNMCTYKEKCVRNCRFCGLSEQNRLVGEVTVEEQLLSLEDALEITKLMGNNRTVLEILPDGSFLNDLEVPVATQTGMMSIVSRQEYLHKVAIETRPEYCNANKVRRLLSHLRRDQQLNLYFGLETTDDFVSAVVHRKGYGFKYFKDRIRELWANLTEVEKKQVHISVYNIIKPVYLSESESVEMSVRMAEDIAEFSKELGVFIDIKYEPSVVTKDTAQEYLYRQTDLATGERKFKPISYFSVAELVARLAEKNLHHLAKFGQRDDIDVFSTVAMVAQLDNEKMYSQFDFMVYNAVQRFNSTKNLRGFLVDLKIVVENSEEFKKWEVEVCGGIGNSSLSKLLTKTFEESNGSSLTKEENERVDFQKKVWIVCDNIEYNQEFSEALRGFGQAKENYIKLKIAKLFTDSGIKIFEIKKFVLNDVGRSEDPRLPQSGTSEEFYKNSDKSAFQIEIIIFNELGQPQNVWVKIPLVYVPIPGRPDYIYN